MRRGSHGAEYPRDARLNSAMPHHGSTRPSGIRRLARRVTAAVADLRSPRARLRAARARREFLRAHHGLRTRIGGGARGRVLVVSMSPDLEQVRLEAILIKALQVHGADVRVLAFRGARESVREFRALGINRFLFYEDLAPTGGGLESEAQRLLAGCSTLAEVKSLSYRDAGVGRQALSTVVRSRHEPTLDLGDPDVAAAVEQTLTYGMAGVDVGEHALDAFKPDCLLMIERGYASVGAISDVALNRGVPVIQFGSAHRDDAFFLKRYTPEIRSAHPRSIDERSWNEVLADGLTDDRERRLSEELEAREQGKWFLARRIRHSGRRRSPEQLRADLGLDDRKVAVLFSHVLWDASMFYGEDLYVDQGVWFQETLRLATENDRVQWLVKLHPALLWKLRTETSAEPAELRMIRAALGDMPPHMRLIMPDDDVDNVDLFRLIDAGVTIRGTIGIELPCLGVPVLTAGTSDYAGRGFTVDAATVAEYERNVRRIGQLPRLGDEQIRLAKLYAYGIFCRRPWPFQSFALDYLPLDQAGDTLLHRLRLMVSSLEELRAADDLGAFARWVLESDAADYLQPEPASSLVTTV
jgi:hypothetical protein